MIFVQQFILLFLRYTKKDPLGILDRFNFAVQATPNRKDIPPQSILTYQVNSNLDVPGSLDKNGQLKIKEIVNQLNKNFKNKINLNVNLNEDKVINYS